MWRSKVLDEIEHLDPVRDHQRIVFLSCRVDFPFDTTRALEFALFRTFCVPSISALLHRTGEFEARPQKRYDDTDLIVSEMMDEPVLVAFGFPKPAAPTRRAVELALRTRAVVLRFLPRRTRPCLRTGMTHRSYPDGYRIEELGPNSSPVSE